MKKVYNYFLILFYTSLFVIGGFFAYWFIRPNTSHVEPSLGIESWDVPSQSAHDAFTDMVYWNGEYYLTFRAAALHTTLDDSKVVILKSSDAKTWTNSYEFSVAGRDIRDPKMAVIGTRLFIYCNIRIIGTFGEDEITTTQYSYTDDGATWTVLKDIQPANKRFWRPKTNDSVNWYCPIFEDRVIELYNTTDGINWIKVSTLLDGQGADEVDIEFLPDGKIIAVIRQQLGASAIGNNELATLIAVSNYDYTSWTFTQSMLTRLDGPSLFKKNNKIYAVGRWQPEVDIFLQLSGSLICKKRTSLYLIEQDKIVYISDLPSSGDTSYPAAVVRGSSVYISYYTNDPIWDYPWFLGSLMSTRVRIAKISLSRLESLANKKLTDYQETGGVQPSIPWLDYVIYIGSILVSSFLAIRLSKYWKDKVIIKREKKIRVNNKTE
jgi:hypothetical protein